MKIELNPARMTIEELDDVIAELSLQRERLMKKERERERINIEMDVNSDAINYLSSLESLLKEYEFNLKGTLTNGEKFNIPLDLSKFAEWAVYVKIKSGD